mmetsp:Transcript_77374/g.213893  ORF Transcript_77374/g.213893 Transcript_77374/m.213893 type:complete len:200 (-) Transcript_77374:2169-2768(-)
MCQPLGTLIMERVRSGWVRAGCPKLSLTPDRLPLRCLPCWTPGCGGRALSSKDAGPKSPRRRSSHRAAGSSLAAAVPPARRVAPRCPRWPLAGPGPGRGCAAAGRARARPHSCANAGPRPPGRSRSRAAGPRRPQPTSGGRLGRWPRRQGPSLRPRDDLAGRRADPTRGSSSGHGWSRKAAPHPQRVGGAAARRAAAGW